MTTPITEPNQIERPMTIAVGQRWACSCMHGDWFTVQSISPSGYVHVKWEPHPGVYGGWDQAELFAKCTYLGMTPAPTPTGPSGEGRPMEADENGEPARCLACGGYKPGFRFHCGACQGSLDEVMMEARKRNREDWRAGVRDFPRRPPSPQIEAEAPTKPKVSCVDCADDITERARAAVVGGGWRCVPCNGEFQARVILAKPKEAQPAPVVGDFVITGIDWGKGVPVKREVSTNGRDWLDYDRLTDADPFEAYRHRRENGVVIAAREPRGHGNLTFAEYAYGDKNRRLNMDTRDALAKPLAKRAPVTPWLSTDSKPPQQHAYFTPSHTRGSGRP